MSSRSTRTRRGRSDALAHDGPDDLALALSSRDLLLSAARALVAATVHEPHLGGCPDCERCRLAHRLAGVENDHPDDDHAGDPDRGMVDFDAAAARFEAALTGAVDAVRRCRRTEHRRTGHCWFAAVPDLDGCGEILRAVHRLG